SPSQVGSSDMLNAWLVLAILVCAATAIGAAMLIVRQRRDALELLAGLEDAVLIVGANGRIRVRNPAFLAWFGDAARVGADLREVVGDRVTHGALTDDDANHLLSWATRVPQEPIRIVVDGYVLQVRVMPLSCNRHALILQDQTRIERLTHAIKRVERERTTLLDLVPVGLTITASGSGEVRYANSQAASYLGFEEAGDLIGRSGLEFCTDSEQRDHLQLRLREDGYVDRAELELRTRTGAPLWVLVSARAIELDHERQIFISVSNITHNKQTELELRDSEQKLRNLLDAAPCAIFMIDAEDNSLLFFNRHADDTFGLRVRMSQHARPDFMPPADLAALLGALRQDGSVSEREVQCEVLPSSALHWFHASVARVYYEGRRAMFCALLDIDARRQAEVQLRLARAEAETANRELRLLNMELEQIASTDRLTSVFNRRHFEEVALREMSRARRYNLPLALIIIDLDHFKHINDDFGHAAGDRVLIEFTQLARTHLRSSDVLARWGGEEFVILATSTALDEAVVLADKIRELLAGHDFEGLRPVTLSAGVTSLSMRDTFDAFVRRADTALYQAKSAGRNRVMSMEQSQAA
ncbi:MAG: diguanylate cyclase, partial [Rhodocyclaceae bacterium]